MWPDLLLLAGSAFLAATLLPFYSEIILITMAQTGDIAWVWLWAAATVGNTGGACVNWLIGRYLLHYQDRRWFPFREQQLEKAQQRFQRYGQWTLLLSWLPVGGDALTFVAGVMRVHFIPFVLLTGVGKGARYAVVLWALDSVPV